MQLKSIGFVLLAFGSIAAAYGATTEASSRRSCESWQTEAEQSGGVPREAAARTFGPDAVVVYAAPASSCACPGALLEPSSVVRIDRTFNGYVRVLYLNSNTREQVSGWVRSTQLHLIAQPRQSGL